MTDFLESKIDMHSWIAQQMILMAQKGNKIKSSGKLVNKKI
jgi:hypothetical protein